MVTSCCPCPLSLPLSPRAYFRSFLLLARAPARLHLLRKLLLLLPAPARAAVLHGPSSLPLVPAGLCSPRPPRRASAASVRSRCFFAFPLLPSSPVASVAVSAPPDSLASVFHSPSPCSLSDAQLSLRKHRLTPLASARAQCFHIIRHGLYSAVFDRAPSNRYPRWDTLRSAGVSS